jgi:FtsP/CotA-like multicopper oxidase with cupredoxin domain
MGTLKRIGRREFLALAAAGTVTAASARALPASRPGRADSAPGGGLDLDVELRAAPATAPLLPGRPTDTWAYTGRVLAGDPAGVAPVADGYLGPVVRVRSGQRVRFRFANGLPEESNVHWHGLHVPADMDGHPRDVVAPGGSFDYEFQVADRAGTYWFHPHIHGRTGRQAYMGLAGLILVSDSEEDAAGLPAGEYDAAFVLQDRSFSASNQFLYGAGGHMSQIDGVLGDRILVNGRVSPRLDVRAALYRFRFVNGSNSRIYKLAWGDGTPMTVIATDGGLLEAPTGRPYAMLAPGERIEVLADFGGRRKGTQIELRSLAFEGAGAMGGMTGDPALPDGAEFPVIRFRVRRRARDAGTIPTRLSTVTRYRLEDAANAASPRRIELSMAHPVGWAINGRTFELDEVLPDEVVGLGTLEAWEIVNVMAGGMHGGAGMAHPFHLHGFQFQVLGREVEPDSERGWLTVRDGYVDGGWKDTVLVMPGERVRLLVRFADFSGTYVYHCHNLEHADAGMMRNFRVI